MKVTPFECISRSGMKNIRGGGASAVAPNCFNYVCELFIPCLEGCKCVWLSTFLCRPV